MAKYDVFISCKSEDYKFAEEIYDFLNANGIYTFLASKELRRLGESEYRRAISKALREACHLIVFASNPEYIESTWVEYEWDMFVNAKLKGKKSGNIITILKGVDTDDIPMDLWKYESFQFEDYRDGIIQYVETPESIARNTEKKKQEEETLRKKKEEEAKAARARELKAKLATTAVEYKKSVSALQVDIDKINSLLEELDITTRECPICRTSISIEANVCNICGWPISPLEGLPDLEYLNSDSENLQRTFSGIYKEYQILKQRSESTPVDNGKVAELENTIKRLKDEISSLKEEQVVTSQPETRQKKTDELEYLVYVTFCPARAEKIIAEYITDFDPGELRVILNDKRPFFVGAFSSNFDAERLKWRLEGLGATVEIREEDEIVDKYSTSPDLQSSEYHSQTTGIQINSCGGNLDGVAQLLPLYFGRSKNSFKSVLQTLPYSTPRSLTKEQAIELSAKLKQLGVSSLLI